MGTSDDVIKDKMDKTIAKLEAPTTGTCPAHGPLAEGVSLLLQIQKTELGSVDPSKPETEVNLPFNLGSLKGVESRDILRMAGLLLMGFIVWMLWTDKQERTELLKHLSTQQPSKMMISRHEANP